MRLLLALLMAAGTSFGHRLDEYLQATLISVEKDRIQAQIRLTPGVAVLPRVMAIIDLDRDGALSEAEQRTYAKRVLSDLSLSIDGNRIEPRLLSTAFPKAQQFEEGLGEIQIDFVADVPGGGVERNLVFENHHLSPIAIYLVNCLVPKDTDIQVKSQNRNEEQSHYRLEYSQNGGAWPLAWGALAVLLGLRLASLWRQGPQRGGGAVAGGVGLPSTVLGSISSDRVPSGS